MHERACMRVIMSLSASMSTLSRTNNAHTYTLSLSISHVCVYLYADTVRSSLSFSLSLSLSLSPSARGNYCLLAKGAKEKERWPCSTVPGAAGRRSGSHRGTLTQHPPQSPRVCTRRHRAAAAPARCRRPRPPMSPWWRSFCTNTHKFVRGRKKFHRLVPSCTDHLH